MRRGLAANLARLARRDALGASQRLPEPAGGRLEIIGGLALDLGRPGQGDHLEFGGGQEPGLKLCCFGHVGARIRRFGVSAYASAADGRRSPNRQSR